MTVPYLSQDFIRSIDSDEDIPDLDSDNEQVSELASNTFNSQVDLDQPTQIKPKKIGISSVDEKVLILKSEKKDSNGNILEIESDFDETTEELEEDDDDEDDDNELKIDNENDNSSLSDEETETSIPSDSFKSKKTKRKDVEDGLSDAKRKEEEQRKKSYFSQDTFDTPIESDSFASMKLSRPILKGLNNLGFIKPTPIQARAIPLGLQGLDICGAATTGSGKTAAFLVPILERLLFRSKKTPAVRVLILVPTRELGMQCHQVAKRLCSHTDIEVCLCVGGLSLKPQENELKKRPDIVVATPGRLIDHVRNSQSFHLDDIEILVMDEADRMLEDGFTAELNEIIQYCPKRRQTMLFSATMTDKVDDLIKLSLKRPVRLFVNHNQSMANRLIQEFVRVRQHREEDRPSLLIALCSRTFQNRVIIFFRSKAAAHHMKIIFSLLGLKSSELHGDLTQEQRSAALASFRNDEVNFLLATDLASRGLDIDGVKTVINYDMPQSYSQYVHRVGRTARKNRDGRAVSLVGEMDRKVLRMAVKNSSTPVKHRVIPAGVLSTFQLRLAKLQDAIKEIYKREKEEKELVKAEMEVSKAENMIKHRETILSRPARTWFQSEKEKAESRAAGKQVLENKTDKNSDVNKVIKRSKDDGLSRKRKRRRMLAEDENHLKSQKLIAKSAKSSLKPKRLQKIAH